MLCTPPALGLPGEPVFLLKRLLKKLANTPSLAALFLMFGSGFFTDVPGEALGTLAGPPRPCVLGEPEGPLAGDS